MKIAIVEGTASTVGGSHRVAAEIARLGETSGAWQATVVLSAEGVATRWFRQQGFDVEVVAARQLPSGTPLPRQAVVIALGLPRFWARLAARLREVDVVHVHDLRGLLLAGPAAVLARRRLIWNVHSAARAQRLHALATRLLLLVGVAVVVPSRRGAVSWAGRMSSKLVELPNACAPATVVPEGPIPLVVTIGRRHPDKGHAMLLEAFGVVRRSVPDARLLLIAPPEQGQPEYDAKLTQLAAVEGVELTGVVADVAAARAGAWVYCQPSLFEPFGLAALEASAAGLPVVACAVGGLPDVVVDGVTGLLVPPEATVIAAALIELLGNADRRLALGSAGRTRVIAEFSPGEFTRRLKVLYRIPEHEGTPDFD